MKITELNHYPVKSLRGITLTQAAFTPQGIHHDREWLIATPNGDFLTARQFPKLLHFQTEIFSATLKITPPDPTQLTVHSNDYQHNAPVKVWKDTFTAWQGDVAADTWLSDQLGLTVRLYWLGAQTTRVLPPDTPLSFADGAPFLLTNTRSLADLNQTLGESFEMARFRANIVMDGDVAWAEESWQRIRIGTAEFELFKPCKRCVLTTIDLQTLEKHPKQQPLAYLAQTRNAIFGMNLRTRASGVLRVGDAIEILA